MPTPSEIQTCIDNLSTSSETIDFTLLAAETANANTGVSFTVPTVNDLPDLETTNIGAGQIFFVESIGVTVVSTVNEWKGLDGRLLRRDYDPYYVFSWGTNNNGQVGIGENITTCMLSPVREFCSATNWCQVSAGGRCTSDTGGHSAAIKTNGELWAWGNNGFGQLGDGSGVDKCSPVREISSSTDWCQVSASYTNTSAIKTSGELWSWGCNRGRLGDGTSTSRSSPVREFCSATNWCQVSNGGRLGNGAAAAIKTSGELWSWGCNCCGILGDGTTVDKCSPVREFCSATDWCQVSGGSVNFSAVKTSGELWSWGCNCCFQLADGTTTSRCSPIREICSATNWCQVSAGKCYTAALKTSGELWAWGVQGSLCPKLGDGTTVTRCSPVREFCSATDWCQVSAGTDHTAAIKTSSQLWVWGDNSCGRLGDGTDVRRCSPVREFFSARDWCQVSAAGHTIAISFR